MKGTAGTISRSRQAKAQAKLEDYMGFLSDKDKGTPPRRSSPPRKSPRGSPRKNTTAD